MPKLAAFIVALLMLLLAASLAPLNAQAPTQRLPPPHLGYGLHLDPNVPVDPAMVDELGMDWVKLYDDAQIPQFPNKRILFRQDMDYPTDWNNFRAWLTERTRRLSSQGVEAIEIHNEPNLSLEWRDQPPNAAEYTEMLRVAYQTIKAVDPNMIVVSGGLAPTETTPDRMAVSDIEYAREMLRLGAANWFDAFGYHPYGYNAPPEQDPAIGRLNFRRTELIWDLLVQYGVTDTQIWLTEFGWLRDPAEDGVNCSDQDPDFQGFAWLRVDGATQADYTARAFQYADRNWPWAGPTFLWNLNFSQRPNDGSLAMCSHQRWFGLLRLDGSRTLAYQRMASLPKRYSNYLPTMILYADEMTAETSVFCPGSVQVGTFNVGNTGYPGSFTASIQPAVSPNGPPVEVSASSARVGSNVDVFVDATGLSPGLHVVYVNVRATIGGQLRAQNVRGFVIVRETGDGEC